MKHSDSFQVREHSFYSIIKPSDRKVVKGYIDRVKAWSPVHQNEQHSGGHGYCTFSLLKVSSVRATNCETLC